MNLSPETLLVTLVAVPGCLFLLLGLFWLVAGHVPERMTALLTKVTYTVLTLVAVTLAWRMWAGGLSSVQVKLGDWFSVGGYSFPLVLMVDALSLPIVVVTVVLAGIVGAFSLRYLHRDIGFPRFFLLLYMFTFGALLVFTAGTLDLLIAGWEVVGITSVLLIGFFQYRREPARNALRVFSTYRVADLNILLAMFLAHHWFGTATWAGMFEGVWPAQTSQFQGTGATVIAVLLVFAASGKSSQGPFCGWLPRAMEGPTPSSAIFYGAISVHAGAYLLLRIQPLLQASPVAAGLAVFIGLTTAVLGTLIHRTCADAKTSVTYAAQTQLGLIFAEIALGWTTLAVVHIVGHAIVRTMQFLRTPSMLRDYHRVHAAAGGQIDPTGEHYESLLPPSAQLWLYRVALGRGFYDSIVDRFIVAPVRGCARLLAALEPGWTPETQPPSPPARADEVPAEAAKHQPAA